MSFASYFGSCDQHNNECKGKAVRKASDELRFRNNSQDPGAIWMWCENNKFFLMRSRSSKKKVMNLNWKLRFWKTKLTIELMFIYSIKSGRTLRENYLNILIVETFSFPQLKNVESFQELIATWLNVGRDLRDFLLLNTFLIAAWFRQRLEKFHHESFEIFSQFPV